MKTIDKDFIRLYVESDALRLAELVRTGEVSPTELTELAISLIEQLNPKLNAVVIKTFELAREMAASAPTDGIFAGVPFLLKDIGSMWAGTRMTAGMAYRKDVVCNYDSEMVRRIKAAGFVLLGRTNVPENGWCIATESKLHGPAINPWNEAVTPGGSSGGAAVAVASRMVPLAEGTDGGGSIRPPAAGLWASSRQEDASATDPRSSISGSAASISSH
jgi:amidase